MTHTNRIKKGDLVKYPFFLLIVFILSCTKETELGLEVLPEEDQLGIVVDTFDVRSYTIENDTVETDEQNSMLIGAYIDPTFGKVSTKLYTQFLTETTAPIFTDLEVVFDSAVLGFRYDLSVNGVYSGNLTSGNPISPVTLRVHELTQDLYLADKYYNNSTASYNSQVLGEVIDYVPNPFDSVVLDTIKEPAQVRIKLDSAWARNIFFSNEIAATDSSFTDFFKGLAIVADDFALNSGEGSILYLQPYSSYTRIEFYFRTRSNPNEEFISDNFRLIIDANTARFNEYEIDHTNTDVANALADTSIGSEIAYIQGLGGPHLFVKCDGYLDYFKENPGILNLAELIIPVQDPNADFALSPALFIQQITPEGGVTVVLDQLEGTGHIDGFYNSDRQEYRIVLTRQMHTFIEAYKAGEILDFGFNLGPTNEKRFANRTIVQGFAPTSGEKVRFRFVYTPI